MDEAYKAFLRIGNNTFCVIFDAWHNGYSVVYSYPISCLLGIFIIVFLFYYLFFYIWRASPRQITDDIRREIKNQVNHVKDLVGVGSRPRFRKRDKIYFYGRKMLRKVRANISTRPIPSRMAKRFARQFLGRPERDMPPQLKVIEPSVEYMQEELTHMDPAVPSEFVFMLRSIRVFGNFEMPLFLELFKSMQTVKLCKGQLLFEVGENDENIFIVQKGRLLVFISEPDGTTLDLKEVTPGENIISLISFCDVLTGHPHPYKTVSSKALEDSIVMKFPVKSFQKIFLRHPDMFVRVVQIVMARLMRVTFLALHEYIGLSAELMNRVPRKDHNTIIPVLSSPGKSRQDSLPGFSEVEECGLELQSPESPERKSNGSRKIVLFDRKSKWDEEKLSQIAVEKFKCLLHLQDDALLKGAVQIHDALAGSVIIKQDSHQDIALVYVLAGALEIYQENLENNVKVHMFTALPSDVVGGLALLSGDPSFYTVIAKQSSLVSVIPKETFYSIIKENPEVVLHVANSVISRLSQFVRQIDFALDWEHLQAGRALYRQGDATDSTFIVLNGRLRSVITHPNGHKEVVGEYGKGDLVGIVELLTNTDRSTTVMAVRDSELAKLPKGLFNMIKIKQPTVMTRLIKLLGQRILGTWKSYSQDPLNLHVEKRPSESNFSTVAIVPVSEDVPLSQFTLELYHSLQAIGSTIRLTSEYVVKSLGVSIWESANEYQLISWLGHIEDQNRMTLYQCDSLVTVWTQRCIRQADAILIVGLADSDPQTGKIEYYTDKVLNTPPNIQSDFSRLARVLMGTSIGLVLGGGGSRGAAHIGMMKAFEEVGIPIDMVAGVSIGALFGSLFCLERNLTRVTQKAREFSMKMTSKWRMAVDLTYPMVSMFSGAGFNQLIYEAVRDTNIEDLWLPFFTLTTDISNSTARIHTHGSLWQYIRASMSLSGYMPPLCDPHDGHLLLDGGYVNNLPGLAWIYIRASMSLAMLLPPMPDPIDGHLLLDGCYINNVPADVMKSKWNVGTVIAIDVGSQFSSDFTNYGDSLSGWNLLARRMFPFKYFFRKELKVPSLYDIQSRLSYVSCTRQLEDLKASNYCEYIRPPIDKFQTLQFGAFDEIKDVGYHHGKSYFMGMLKSGRTVEEIYHLRREPLSSHDASLHASPANFTDLAELVCCVKKSTVSSSAILSTSEGEEEEEGTGYASEPNTATKYFQESNKTILELQRMRTGSLSDDEILLK